MTKQLTSEELKQKINNKENFVLDLFATWCGPCKIMLGNLEKVNESLIQKGTIANSQKEKVLNKFSSKSISSFL
jgi:thiol-disulfide isomerase/thioredoxin